MRTLPFGETATAGHHGGMRWIVVIAVMVAACSSPPPPATPSPSPAPATPGVAESEAPQLPAAEPVVPSRQEFVARAEQACRTVARRMQRVPLAGDPLAESATAADRNAAIAHYQERAGAWTAAADDLWAFGLPKPRKVPERLITALDTVAQYSQQTAEFFSASDLPTAQAGVGAVADAVDDADAIARRLGMTPFSECGLRQRRLEDARRVPVQALDFDFSVAAAQAGPARFVVRNAGQERHHLFVVRLAAAGTLAEALRADRAGESPGALLRGKGAVSPVAVPGERATLDVVLRPGAYGLLCFLASPDGTPHAYKGMSAEILVP